jgi:hypothetical protein
MSGDVIDFAMRRYRSMRGKRCTISLPEEKPITGKVLGLYNIAGKTPYFLLRARESHYIPLSRAVLLREIEPATKRIYIRWRAK